ncbi:SprT-like domain-containing protein [Leucobacter sp. HY1910]
MAELERVRVWGEALINMYLPKQGWQFGFDHAKRRAGLCHFGKKQITVSRYLAVKFSDEEIYQTLLHEVAHALAGPDAGHGPRWKRLAEVIGYVGGTTHQGEIAHEHAPWVGACPAGHAHYKFRAPTRDVSCGRCQRGFSPAHLIRWQRRAH